VSEPLFLIWNTTDTHDDWSAFWRQNGDGYEISAIRAGRFTAQEAEERTRSTHGTHRAVPEGLAIRLSDQGAAAVRRSDLDRHCLRCERVFGTLEDIRKHFVTEDMCWTRYAFRDPEAERDCLRAASEPHITPPTRPVELRPGFILTSKGPFWPLDPNIEDIRIEDIAYSLAGEVRWGNFCRPRWTVAEHCLHVMSLVPPPLQLCALLHDAEEAYPPNDVCKPLKDLPEFAALREPARRLRWLIFRKFGLPPGLPDEVKLADGIALATERRDLMPPLPGVTFPDDRFTPDTRTIQSMHDPDRDAVCDRFLSHFFRLVTERAS
jgi:hypothetical protein